MFLFFIFLLLYIFCTGLPCCSDCTEERTFKQRSENFAEIIAEKWMLLLSVFERSLLSFLNLLLAKMLASFNVVQSANLIFS